MEDLASSCVRKTQSLRHICPIMSNTCVFLVELLTLSFPAL